MIKYDLLSKIYHDVNRRHRYHELYQRRFEGEGTFHLPLSIRNKRGESLPLFVVMTTESYMVTQTIYMDLEKLDILMDKLPRAAIDGHIRNFILVDEMVQTNAIEGIHSSRKEIEQAMDANKQKGYQKNIRFKNQVAQYMRILQGKWLRLSSSEEVRNLFDEFVAEEVRMENENELPDGRIFRKEEVSVVSGTGKAIHQGVMPEDEIIGSMEKLLQFLYDDRFPVLLRAAIGHYYFGYIHPFYNGNGRLNRLITSDLLAKDFHRLVALRLSVAIHEKQKQYYHSFEAVNDGLNKGDATVFFNFFLDLIHGILDELLEDLGSKRDVLLYAREKIETFEDISKDERFLLYILQQAKVFSEKALDVDALAKNAKMKPSKVRIVLKKLTEKGYVTIDKSSRAYQYVLNDDIF